MTSAVLGVGGHHKSGDVRRLNGVIPRMNITPNPLAQEAASDKVSNQPSPSSSLTFSQLHPVRKTHAKLSLVGWSKLLSPPSYVVSLSASASVSVPLALSLSLSVSLSLSLSLATVPNSKLRLEIH